MNEVDESMIVSNSDYCLLLIRENPGITRPEILERMTGATTAQVSAALHNNRLRGRICIAGKKGRYTRYVFAGLSDGDEYQSENPRALLLALNDYIKAEVTPRSRVRYRRYLPLPTKELREWTR